MHASCVLWLILASTIRLIAAATLLRHEPPAADTTVDSVGNVGIMGHACEARPTPMDYVVLAEKLDCVADTVIKSLLRFASPRRVLVVAPAATCTESNFSYSANVKCISENMVLPHVSKESTQGWLRSKFGREVDDLRIGLGSHTMAGWYLQQFLKMGIVEVASELKLSQNYVVWDSDMVLLRDFCPFNVKGQVHLMEGDSGPENICNKGYQRSYQKLTGLPYQYSNLHKKGFTTHHMVVSQLNMRDLLARIGSTNAKHWTTAILEASCPDLTSCSCGFSEYGSYASWLKRMQPHRIMEVPLMFERNAHVAHPKVGCCPDQYPKYFQNKTKEGLLFVSFERSCTKSKNYIGIDKLPR